MSSVHKIYIAPCGGYYILQVRKAEKFIKAISFVKEESLKLAMELADKIACGEMDAGTNEHVMTLDGGPILLEAYHTVNK